MVATAVIIVSILFFVMLVVVIDADHDVVANLVDVAVGASAVQRMSMSQRAKPRWLRSQRAGGEAGDNEWSIRHRAEAAVDAELDQRDGLLDSRLHFLGCVGSLAFVRPVRVWLVTWSALDELALQFVVLRQRLR